MQLLTGLLITPLCGAILIAVLPANSDRLYRNVALITSVLTMMISFYLLSVFDTQLAGLQFTEHMKWNPRLGMAYDIGVDGISLPMIVLATVLCFIAVLASGNIKDKPRGYYLLMLLLETAMLGVFMAQDWVLFYVFWELTLIPLFFLIDRWGGKQRHGAALNFVLYTFGGSVFLLVAMLVLFDSLPAHSFSMSYMAEAAASLPDHKQMLIFLGFLIGFGVKMPIFPIHGWLPVAHVEAPSPVSILLSGILLKMGAYGLLRATGMLPNAVLQLQTMLMVLALISIVYGGLLAWRQTDMKKMIAYSSVSHMGVVLLGIATLNITGFSGAVMQMVAHGLVAGAMFLLIGLLYERTHTRDIRDFSSLVRTTPRFAFFTIFAFIAAIGFPGTAGFIAELHVLIGGFQQWGWLILALSLGIMISAAYAIRTIGRLFTGPRRENMKNVSDLHGSEMLAAGLLTAATILLGVFPAFLLQYITPSVASLSRLFN
ncbi:MAG: NADH-quinone oxidoreductase subunit M [Gammaproteobacteria bacterium]|nr:MAG: NADH-quinone oxidoreductase subunit M [Gammaproteobacteria bacterium]